MFGLHVPQRLSNERLADMFAMLSGPAADHAGRRCSEWHRPDHPCPDCRQPQSAHGSHSPHGQSFEPWPARHQAVFERPAILGSFNGPADGTKASKELEQAAGTINFTLTVFCRPSLSPHRHCMQHACSQAVAQACPLELERGPGMVPPLRNVMPRRRHQG